MYAPLAPPPSTASLPSPPSQGDLELQETMEQWKQRPHLITLLNPALPAYSQLNLGDVEPIERDDFLERFYAGAWLGSWRGAHGPLFARERARGSMRNAPPTLALSVHHLVVPSPLPSPFRASAHSHARPTKQPPLVRLCVFVCMCAARR
jgi:hypothetical protein